MVFTSNNFISVLFLSWLQKEEVCPGTASAVQSYLVMRPLRDIFFHHKSVMHVFVNIAFALNSLIPKCESAILEKSHRNQFVCTLYFRNVIIRYHMVVLCILLLECSVAF